MNDPVTMREEGTRCYGRGEYEDALEYWKKAAVQGDAAAHYELSVAYDDGTMVEKDAKKQLYHLEEAAIQGHVDARSNLGCVEAGRGRYERAMLHFIISASNGHDRGLGAVRQGYIHGRVDKENFAKILRAHQTAVDAARSDQRKVGESSQSALESHRYSEIGFSTV